MRDIEARLGALDTSALSDALDRLGLEGQAVGISPVDRSIHVVGQAYTVRMLPRGLSGKSVGDYIDEVPSGQVVVIDNGGRLDTTVWGELLTAVASRNGVSGTVIDGVCRDVGRCLELRYPLYSRAITMRTGKDRVSAEAYCEPVQLAGVRVEAGDWICGDADGIVIVPASVAEQVIAVAEEITVSETHIRDGIAEGERLDIARKRAGYHTLQSPGQVHNA